MNLHFSLPCLVMFGAVSCRTNHSSAVDLERAQLGHVEFPSSGPSDAQEPFLRGVLLLHSFEYQDAAEAFREAQTVAPDFALAYWGEALTHCHPIWQEEDRNAAQAVLARLAPTATLRAAKAGDERERELLSAVETLFGEGTRHERAEAYSAAMQGLHQRLPEDLEIKSLYSLSILGTATQGRDVPTYIRAGAVAEEVLESAPDHPGALHYAIHSYDDPVHAPLGLRMARRYGKVAPSADHALHMPSHIYVALGMWEESVQANIDSSAAADSRRARKNLGVDARGYHSLSWLLYSRLQMGETDAAEKLLRDMIRDEAASHSKRTRSHLVAMRAAWAVATQRWDDEYARLTVDTQGLDPASATSELYLRGRNALARGERHAAEQALQAMAPVRGPLESVPLTASGVAQCCRPGPEVDYLPHRLASRVMEIQLSGLMALHSGEPEQALDLLRTAADKEDATGFDFGPPLVVEPAHELLGHVLLELGQSEAAAREFEKALTRAPRRARSAEGLHSARATTDSVPVIDDA